MRCVGFDGRYVGRGSKSLLCIRGQLDVIRAVNMAGSMGAVYDISPCDCPVILLISCGIAEVCIVNNPIHRRNIALKNRVAVLDFRRRQGKSRRLIGNSNHPLKCGGGNSG